MVVRWPAGGVGFPQRAILRVEFAAGFHDADRVGADRAFGGFRFQDAGQLMEWAASVAPATYRDEAFVVEPFADGVPVCLDLAVVVLEVGDRGIVAALTGADS